MPTAFRLTRALMALALLVLWAAPQLCAAQLGVPGGWSSAAVTNETRALLERALKNESGYRADVSARVCVFEIRALSQQVVAGTNYRFEVQACKVASAANAGTCGGRTLTTNASVCDDYTIQLFEQPWTSTLEVTAIELLAAGSSPSPSPSSSGSSTSTPTPTASNSSSSTSSNSTVANDSDATKSPSPSPTPQSAARASHFGVVAALVSSVALALAV